MKLLFIRPTLLLMAHLVILACLISCTREENDKINLTSGKVMVPVSSAKGPEPLKIGMGAMITPKEGYNYYYQLKEYLAQKIGWPVELVDRDTYEQLNKLLKSGELQISFVGAGPYAEGHDKLGLDIIAAPVVKGSPTFQSYIIVPQKSMVRDFLQLRNMNFAFSDPKSITGKLYPTYLLAKINETPASFFKKTVYTYGHDKIIKAVAENFVDGAALSSLVWENMAIKHPELTAKTRIIAKSPPYGIPPLIATKRLDPHLKKLLRETLLAMHTDPAGKKILDKMNIDRFTMQPDSAYNSVREIQSWFDQQQEKK